MKTHTIGVLILGTFLTVSSTSRLAGEASRITSITPAAARAGGFVTITGNGFGARNVRVTVGGVAATVIAATGNCVVFRVPAGVQPGPTTVTATNPGGETGSIAFTVIGGAPVANAGPDQTVVVGALVELDGSGSSDPDGQALSFQWSFVSRPATSQSALSSTTAVRPTFVPDVPGTYEAQLVVSDGIDVSVADTVRIDTRNSPPVANAGPDQTAPVGGLVSLDGGASSDVDGDALSFAWSFASRPAGSAAELVGAATAAPTFIVDRPGRFLIQLVVHDGQVPSEPDLVQIDTSNSVPVANAGPDQAIQAGETVILDGRGSADVDGDALVYSWSFVTRPEGSEAALNDLALVNPMFVADIGGLYVLQLIVSDGTAASEADTVAIEANQAPIVDAGVDQAVTLPQVVTLAGGVADDGLPWGGALTIAWSHLDGPPGVVFSRPDQAATDATFPGAGYYTLRLTASDGQLETSDDVLVAVDLNECPTNNGGCDPLTSCTSTIEGRVCGACPMGYTGTGDTLCVDINECAENNGGCNWLVVCTNTPGSFLCGPCPPGFFGDGVACADIDECTLNNGECDPLTACTNTIGSRICGACPAGYTGDGASGCADIDECAVNNGGCDPLTTCTNTPASRSCGACPAGYGGSGEIGCFLPALLAAGPSHSLAAEADGTLWGWGVNGSGQLGDGTTTQRTAPVAVTSIADARAIAAGANHSLAVKADGTVRAWGSNGWGQIGDNTKTQRNAPVVVTGLTNAIAVEGGTYHSIALKGDGTVWAWGYNVDGQLGDGTTTQRLTPVQVVGLTDVVAIAAGDRHNLALKSDGTVWAWGTNGNGQLGDGTTTMRNQPVQVINLAGVSAIAAGTAHSLAVKTDGTVWAWGWNSYGQLGDGTATQRTTRVQVTGLASATRVAAGSSHSLALLADGSVRSWGYNGNGQLGDGTTTQRFTSVPVSTLGGIVAIAAGDTHNLAVTFDGVVWAWGRNTNGQLGDATTTQRLAPVAIAARGMMWKVVAPALSLASGTYTTDKTVTITCADAGATIHYTTNGANPTEADPAIASGGTVQITRSLTLKAGAWRAGAVPSEIVTAVYELRVPAPTFSPVSGRYASPTSVTIATATPGATVTYTTDGTEPTEASATYGGPVAVSDTRTLKARAFKTGWTSSDSTAASYWITVGAVDTLAISPAGGTYASPRLVTLACATAGATIRYTLDGSDPVASSPQYDIPFLVSTSATVKARAFLVGYAASAIASASYAFDAAGQTPAPSIVPGGGRFATKQTTAIAGPAGAVLRYTTSGADPTEADPLVPPGGTLTIDRAEIVKVRAWQDGLAPSAVRRADFVITGAVAAGHQHSLGLAADGTVWAWGRGSEGQLGDGTGLYREAPVSVFTNARAIDGGQWFSLAARADGTVWAWGYNLNGQLGIGTTYTRHTPTQALGLTDAVAVAAGYDHSLALRSDGTVWAWGGNTYGQLGDGTTTQRLTAVQVIGLSGVTSIAAGEGFSLAVQTDGAAGGFVWAWGKNASGQLGDGSTTSRPVPVRVLDVTDAAQVVAGQAYGAARMADGGVRAWGANDAAQLGEFSGIPSSTAVIVPTPVAFTSVSSGVAHALGLDAEGRVWGWGSNSDGQLGTMNYSFATGSGAPQLMPGVDGAFDAAGGWLHTLVLRADGSVWAVGNYQDIAAIPGLSLAPNAWLTTDGDADGLSAWQEYLAGTDPLSADTNGNGLSDLVDLRRRSRAENPDDDGDGVANAVEQAQGTDPFRADTDADGVTDLLDAYPLDPARSQMPPPVPGDVTPPTITLTEPIGARRVG